MKDIFSVFTKKKWIGRMILAGVIFLLCAAPFKMMLSLRVLYVILLCCQSSLQEKRLLIIKGKN